MNSGAVMASSASIRNCVRAKDSEIRHRVFPIARYTERYAEDDVDCVALIDDLRRTTCLAWVDGCIAGQIIRRENWNRFALVDDIAVVVISGA